MATQIGLQPDNAVLDHMRGSRKFCPRGSNFDNIFFLVGEGRYDANTTKSDFQGIQTSITMEPSFFVIFQGGPDPLSPLWIRPWITACCFSRCVMRSCVQLMFCNVS